MKKNLLKGYTADSLKWALVKQGYSRTLISQAMEIANKELAESAPKIKEKPVIKYEVIDEKDKPIEIKISPFKKFIRRFFY